MKDLEKYYGVSKQKKITVSQLIKDSRTSIVRREADLAVKAATNLFANGHHDQALGLLREVVKMAPNDSRIYYLLGLIYEEKRDLHKAATSHYICAILRKNDTSHWKKMLYLSQQTYDVKKQVLALEKISKKELSKDIILNKRKCYAEMKRKYGVIACDIELFDYCGLDRGIFERFKDLGHVYTLKILCSKLYACVYKNKDAQDAYFVSSLIASYYKIEGWCRIKKLYEDFIQDIKKPGTIADDDNAGDLETDGETELIYLLALENLGAHSHDRIIRLLAMAPAEKMAKFKIYDVVELYFKDKRYNDAISILRELLRRGDNLEMKIKSLEYLGMIWEELNEAEKAGDVYREIIGIDPKNTGAKLRLYDLNKRGGDEGKVKEYEMAWRIAEYEQGMNNIDKKDYRYSKEECERARRRFLSLPNFFEAGNDLFLEEARPLVDDLFSNRFAVSNESQFKSYANRHEKVMDDKKVLEFFSGLQPPETADNSALASNIGARDHPVIGNAEEAGLRSPANAVTGLLSSNELGKRQMKQQILRISSLHGLEISEWFWLMKTWTMALIRSENTSEAVETLWKCTRIRIFGDLSKRMFFYTFLLRLNVESRNVDQLVLVGKEMLRTTNHSVAYLLYFLMSMFPESTENSEFNKFQKGLQKYCCKPCRRIVRGASKSPTDGSGMEIEEEEQKSTSLADLEGDKIDMAFLTACSFISNYLYLSTFDTIPEVLSQPSGKCLTILATVYIAHSKSRVLVDKMKFATIGINFLKGAEDSDLKWYNLGKAYHFYGYYSHAENYYLRGIGQQETCNLARNCSKNAKARRMALYNLLLIFRKNKSHDIIWGLLQDTRRNIP